MCVYDKSRKDKTMIMNIYAILEINTNQVIILRRTEGRLLTSK